MKFIRQKFVRRLLNYYRRNFHIEPPYRIPINGTFVFQALQWKIQIDEQPKSYLQTDQIICSTTCCAIRETKWLGSSSLFHLLSSQSNDKWSLGHLVFGGDKNPRLFALIQLLGEGSDLISWRIVHVIIPIFLSQSKVFQCNEILTVEFARPHWQMWKSISSLEIFANVFYQRIPLWLRCFCNTWQNIRPWFPVKFDELSSRCALILRLISERNVPSHLDKDRWDEFRLDLLINALYRERADPTK